MPSAPSDQDLTENELLDVVETRRKTFSSDYVPIHDKELDMVQRCSDLVVKDRGSIRRNTPKTRAHTILTDIWGEFPEVFVLCSMAIYPTKLGTLKSTHYLRRLQAWWGKVDHPKGLTTTVEKLLEIEILPLRGKRPATPEINTGWWKAGLLDA